MQQTKPKQSSASVLQSLSDRRVLPMFPTVINKLDNALKATSVSIDEVVSILSTDLNTFSRIMKSASGFRYGSQPPKDLAEAVMRLGFAETRALTFAVAYTSSFEKPKNFSMATFWMHAFVSGLAAKEISAWLYRHKKMRVCDGPTAFLLGLAHEVGCLLLDKLNDEDFGHVVDELKTSNESQSALEQKRLGTTHAVIGAALLKYWGFTDNMVMAVAGHHFPGRLPLAQQPIADMVLLAESMAGYMGFDNGVDKATPGMLNSFVSERMQVIGMTEADFLRISERIKDALAEEDWMELASSTGNS
jgi:HD-like signal output (HDOD) protein